MPSTAPVTRIADWATTQRNLTIFRSISVAVPTVYAFQSVVAVSVSAGTFLLLITLAVGVPTAYDEYGPRCDQSWQAIIWTLVACVVVTIEFSGLVLIGTEYLSLSPRDASTLETSPGSRSDTGSSNLFERIFPAPVSVATNARAGIIVTNASVRGGNRGSHWCDRVRHLWLAVRRNRWVIL